MVVQNFKSFIGRLIDPHEGAAVKSPPDSDIFLCPVAGNVIPIQEIGDPAFSEEIVGLGVGVIPREGTVVAPVDGTIAFVPESLHALSIVSSGGREVLIHIGIDTVKLKGAGFSSHVKRGDEVRRGDPLISFDLEQVTGAGFDPTIPVLVTDRPRDFEIELLAMGPTELLAPLFRVRHARTESAS